MPKIAIVDKIHSDGIKLLEDNPKFQYEIIEDLSKKNLISKLSNFVTLKLIASKFGNLFIKFSLEIFSIISKLKVEFFFKRLIPDGCMYSRIAILGIN